MEFNIALLPGDHVGPEITAQAVKVVDEVGRRFDHAFKWHEEAIGGAAIDKYGVPLPKEAVELCRKSDAILFGATGGPKWDSPGSKNRADITLLKLRKEFNLFANLRLMKVFPPLVNASPVKPEFVKGVDLIILRELIGGLYFGEPRGIEVCPDGKRGVNTMIYSQAEIERILRVGFELARQRSGKLLSVDKSNVLEVSVLWREIATQLAPEYPDIELRHMYVDTAAMELMSNPRRFDVVVMENTFGDILSDEAAVLCGSLGMVPSASFSGLPVGKVFGLYEPILHGGDRIKAGNDVNNPIGSILSGALMLRYSFGLNTEAAAIEGAVSRVVESYRTWDIMEEGKKQVGTREMGDLVAAEVLNAR